MEQNIQFNLDPSIFAPFVIFADGMTARMVKTTDFNPETNHYEFCLVPTESLEVMKDLVKKRDTDKRYDHLENHYHFKVPKEYCLLLNFHQAFPRWLLFCDWDLNYMNPFKEVNNALIIENKRLQKERDYLNEALKAKEREISRIHTYSSISRKELIKAIASEIKDLNYMATPENKGDDNA
jgi:hypothetical protein